MHFNKSTHQMVTLHIDSDVIYDQAKIGLDSLDEITKITLAF